MTRPSESERFWAQVEKHSSGCWLWNGNQYPGGYGCMSLWRDGRRSTVGAHRYAYIELIGPIPEGLSLDHLCRVHNCVNPAHLEPVTHRENVLRGQSPFLVACRTNTCLAGHSLEDAYITPSTGGRECRICRQQRKFRARVARRRVAIAAAKAKSAKAKP